MTKGGWMTVKEREEYERAELAKWEAAGIAPKYDAVVEYRNGGSVTQRGWESKKKANEQAEKMKQTYVSVYGEPEWAGAEIMRYRPHV